MGRGFMGLVRDFNQISYAARTIEKIQKSKQTKYGVRVTHGGLGRSKIIRGPSQESVDSAGRQQLAAWDDIWRKQQESALSRAKKELDRQSAEQKALYIAKRKTEAERRTSVANAEIAVAEGILSGFGNFTGKLDWGSLKPNPAFNIEKPALRSLPPAPTNPDVDAEPNRNSPQYELAVLINQQKIAPPPHKPAIRKVGVFGKLFGEQKQADLEYEADITAWNTELHKYHAKAPALIERIYLADHEGWESNVKKVKEAFGEAKKTWMHEAKRQVDLFNNWKYLRDTWDARLGELEKKIQNCRTGYASGDPVAVADYFSAMMGGVERPAWAPQDWAMLYDSSTRRLDGGYQVFCVQGPRRLFHGAARRSLIKSKSVRGGGKVGFHFTALLS